MIEIVINVNWKRKKLLQFYTFLIIQPCSTLNLEPEPQETEPSVAEPKPVEPHHFAGAGARSKKISAPAPEPGM
jgi:hypothetical protein